MIIKIQHFSGNTEYHLFDNIEKIKVSTTLHDDNIEDLEENDIDVYYIKDDIITEKSDSSVRITCTSKSGIVFSIIFNSIAYITNDDGKTIEKIFVNQP